MSTTPGIKLWSVCFRLQLLITYRLAIMSSLTCWGSTYIAALSLTPTLKFLSITHENSKLSMKMDQCYGKFKLPWKPVCLMYCTCQASERNQRATSHVAVYLLSSLERLETDICAFLTLSALRWNESCMLLLPSSLCRDRNFFAPIFD